MPVDASIYANAVPQPINPLATLGQVATTQNAMNQNRLFGQEFAARKAIGQAYSSALDPRTGQVDVNRLVSGVASNPDAAFKAGEVGAQALQQQQGQTALDTAKLELARKHFDSISNMFGGLAAKPDLSIKDFTNAGGDLVAQNISTPQMVATELSQLPQNATPQQLQQIAKQYQLRAMTASEQMNAMYGPVTPINTGSSTVMTRTPGQGGATSVAGVIGNDMAPGDANSPITYFDPATKQMRTITKGQFAAMQNGGAPGSLGTGRYPSAGTAQPSAGPGIAAAPALGAGVAADVAATGSATSLNNLHGDVANSGSRIYQLQSGLQALQGASTGKGSQTPQDIQSFIQTLAPETAKALGIDPTKIANYDEATKYLTGYAQNQAGNFGSHTDTQLATALTANPSTHISNLAATDVVKANIGLERMKQAQAQAFDQSGLPPEQFNKWQVQWNKNVDPRAYMVDQLTPDKYRAMVSSMKPAEKQIFYQNLNAAIQNGFVNLPGQPNAH